MTSRLVPFASLNDDDGMSDSKNHLMPFTARPKCHTTNACVLIRNTDRHCAVRAYNLKDDHLAVVFYFKPSAIPSKSPLQTKVIGSFISSTIGDLSLLFISIRFLLLLFFRSNGVYDHPLSTPFLLLNVANMVASFYGLYESIESRRIFIQALEKQGIPSDAPSVFSKSFWTRYTNPFWIGLDVQTHLCYATERELAEVPKKDRHMLTLDVITPSSCSSNSRRPVFVFVHGGAWYMGSKRNPYPLLRSIAQEGWIVVSVDYRLAPTYPYPSSVVDVKRAIRWVKKNIGEYGGDASFVTVGGDSAGGHIAAMVALSSNRPEYQPNFEDVDTSVKACVAINAVLRLSIQQFGAWFAEFISGREKGEDHTKFLLEHSPVHHVHKDSVPFLVFHGEADVIVDILTAENFVVKYKQANPNKITFIRLKRGTHIYHAFSCPRTHYQAFTMERWLQNIRKLNADS
ncbi:esterase LipO [Planoprotostelium fungivorum]|uniref:Esterase LipO n=1 Tax=Planoprotostelium fungivorum TaxID=1890364 RepID=A0A2P6NLC3_9EUKA|nr:esterase LipO [Planoprotostelium fungivorum]